MRSSRRTTRRSPAISISISTSHLRRVRAASSRGPWRPHTPCFAMRSINTSPGRARTVRSRSADRYFDTSRGVERIDAGVFRDRIKTMLPQLQRVFEQAQATSGIEWRLLAAVAYQESQWDPLATSETGARGVMQLTEETARHLGVGDRLDTKASILAAARYLQMLKSKMPQRIAEPDRTWLALAAFNIGIAHLEDARILAQKQKLNPDHWSDVRKTLPLLAQPEYYESAKFGYARGRTPVASADRVLPYSARLVRTKPLFTPRLIPVAGAHESAR